MAPTAWQQVVLLTTVHMFHDHEGAVHGRPESSKCCAPPEPPLLCRIWICRKKLNACGGLLVATCCNVAPAQNRTSSWKPYEPMIKETAVQQCRNFCLNQNCLLGHSLCKSCARALNTESDMNTESHTSICKDFASDVVECTKACMDGPKAHLHDTGFYFQ